MLLPPPRITAMPCLFVSLNLAYQVSKSDLTQRCPVSFDIHGLD